MVWYAGWADKLAQALGGANAVAGPYFNFTVPEPTGVVATLAPDEPALEGLVSRILPALVSGNVVVAVASEPSPLAAIELAEAVATSDMPGGALNILTGRRSELAPILAGHADVNAIDITGADGDVAELERARRREREARRARDARRREPVGDRADARDEDRLASGRGLTPRRSPPGVRPRIGRRDAGVTVLRTASGRFGQERAQHDAEHEVSADLLRDRAAIGEELRPRAGADVGVDAVGDRHPRPEDGVLGLRGEHRPADAVAAEAVKREAERGAVRQVDGEAQAGTAPAG